MFPELYLKFKSQFNISLKQSINIIQVRDDSENLIEYYSVHEIHYSIHNSSRKKQAQGEKMEHESYALHNGAI